MPARSYGGAVESVYRLCLNLASAGCEIQVLTTNSNGIGRSLSVDTRRPLAMAAGFDVRYMRRLARMRSLHRCCRLYCLRSAAPTWFI